MKKIMAIAILLMMIFSAQAMASGLKIGYANLQRALNESEAGKRAKETLNAEAKEYRTKIIAQEDKLKKFKAEIDKKLAVWNQETKETKVKKFQEDLKDLQQTSRKYDNELNKKRAQTEAEMLKELQEIIKAIAKKKNYTFIFEQSAGGILHAPENANITDELIKQYNKKTR
jgi:outer membrane protein